MLPHGIDFLHDVSRLFLGYQVKIIFDVGANVGQSSNHFLTGCPASHIYCAEPIKETFIQLQANCKSNNRLTCYQVAFGSNKGIGKMVLQGASDRHFLLNQSKKFSGTGAEKTESVEVETLDNFCASQNISRINYLKIDTEGW